MRSPMSVKRSRRVSASEVSSAKMRRCSINSSVSFRSTYDTSDQQRKRGVSGEQVHKRTRTRTFGWTVSCTSRESRFRRNSASFTRVTRSTDWDRFEVAPRRELNARQHRASRKKICLTLNNRVGDVMREKNKTKVRETERECVRVCVR